MRRRHGGGSIAANPVLIGAVTVLVVIVAVYLAYNANSGLPVVPTYDLKAEVPNAAGLVKGNDVRVGGTRVGTVSCIEPQTQPSGEVIAVLCLKLETVVKPQVAMPRMEVFLSTYVAAGFDALVYAKPNRFARATSPEFLRADWCELLDGNYLVFPRDRESHHLELGPARRACDQGSQDHR